MRYELSGTVMQTVGIDLAPGETVYSQTAAMAWMSAGVRMHTNTGGGLFAGHVSDASVLWGLSSALLTDAQDAPVGSAFVQPGAYRAWIDATMLADAADSDAVLWASAVPEPGAWALWAAGLGALAFASRRTRR